ncbi:MAG: ABC transporter permease subunit [Pseudomonadota bacterium]
MTAITDPQGEGFRLSQLIYDTRYRSVTLQIFALILVLTAVGWLLNNAVINLRDAGQDFSYGFLSNPASYDINQQLIEYNSRDSHARAAIVGLLNTLLVAFLACITATVIGVIAGVLRLSSNWLIARLMSVYVEAFRNVPVLIWILIIFSVMTLSLNNPADFRGDDPKASMLFDAVAMTRRGVYIPRPIFEAGGMIVLLTFLASLVGIWYWRRRARTALYDRGEVVPVLWPSIVIFFVPTLVVFFALGQPISLQIPELRGFNFQGGINLRGSLIALWFALAIYTGAFIAENVRAGILAISKGQTEAAAALGLRPGRVMSLVVLPQALRVIIPPLTSQYLNITKNSSLAIAVGYMDITATLGGITLNQTGRAIESVLLLMAFYLAVSLSISAAMNVYNNAVKLKER